MSGTAITTKCPPPDACIFMDKVETCFLEYQKHKQMVWFCYIDVIYLTWTYREQKLKQFLKELNKIYPNLIFMHQPGEGKDFRLKFIY